MGIASIWTGLGLRTSGPDHRAPCKREEDKYEVERDGDERPPRRNR